MTVITALSQQVCQCIEEIERKENMLSQVTAIRATHDVLIKVEANTGKFASLLSLYHNCLQPDEMQRFSSIASRLRAKLHESADNFENDPRQTVQLSQINEQLQKIIKDVQQSWRVYAQQQVAQPFELLKLVLHLPEIQAQQVHLIALQARINRYIDAPPQNETELLAYERSQHELLAYLSSIDGLSREIRNFLLKTVQKQATLADLTDEVLHWCRQRERATAFAITFTH